MSTNCIKCVVNPRTGVDLLCDDCRAALLEAQRQRLEDPQSQFNQRCLADLRKKYPNMTAEEMIANRKATLQKIRVELRAKGFDDVPDNDGDLLRWRWMDRLLGGSW